jgi:hypothetical protein
MKVARTRKVQGVAVANEGTDPMMIGGRFQTGAPRWEGGATALSEGLDLLVGRPVLLETVTGPAATTTALVHPGLPAPQRSGVWDGTAVVVHPWAAAAPLLAAADDELAAQLETLVAALSTLAAAGAVHGGILPESLDVDGTRLTPVGATLAAAGSAAAMPFASPDVRAGQRPSPADDAWSVAALLSNLLAGTAAAASTPATLLAAAEARPALLPAATALLRLADPPKVIPINRPLLAHRGRVAAAAAAVALAGAGTAAALATGLIGPASNPPAAQQAGPYFGSIPAAPTAQPARPPSAPSAPPATPPADVPVVPPIAITPPEATPPAAGTAGTGTPVALVPIALPVVVPDLPAVVVADLPLAPLPITVLPDVVTPPVVGTPPTHVPGIVRLPPLPTVVPPPEPPAGDHDTDADDHDANSDDHGAKSADRDGKPGNGEHRDGEHGDENDHSTGKKHDSQGAHGDDHRRDARSDRDD